MARIPVGVCRPTAKRSAAGPRRRPARRRIAAAFVFAGLGVLTLGVGPAFATNPSCGTTITVSTTLRTDLINCPGDGLVIGADNITLNLKGHTIDGDTISEGDDAGVRVEGHHGTTIRRGTVQEFDHAVHLTSATHSAILGLVATHNGDTDIGRAILLDDGSDYNRIERNDASHNGRSGIALLDSNHNVVLGNRTTLNGVAGMGVFGGSDNKVIANVIADNLDTGIAWGNGSTGGRVTGNWISGHSFAGLAMGASDSATVARNVISGNGGNVIVSGNGNVLRGNVIRDAGGCEGCGDGVSVEDGTGNLVTHNLVIGNALDGIRLDSFDPENSPATGTVIRGNVVRETGRDGISVGTETGNPVPNTRIESNRVSRSNDDGIDVARAGTLLADNAADHNGDLGISAVLGVIDGGGNHAFGNGNLAQCVNIAC
jgi:parallel beta-helix repeat protein